MFGAHIARMIRMGILTAGTILLSAGCKARINERPIGKAVGIKPPLGLPPLPIPPDNPPTAETIALARRLFYAPRLSADNTLACSSCHDPNKWFEDNRPISN